MTRLHLAPTLGRTDQDPSPARSIRVVLGDDHALIRRGVRLLLEAEPGFEVVAEAEDLNAVVRHVRAERPHVLVLDLGMPDGSSIDVIRKLHAEMRGTAIVVLTMEDAPVSAAQALDAGAIGYALKDSAEVELPEAVRSAARGEEYLSPRLTEQIESLRAAVAAMNRMSD